MIKPNSFEKMPGKDPANEQQRTYYLDYLLKEKAKTQVLVDESESKCLKLQELLHTEEIVLRTRVKTRDQLATEQRRIIDFVIEVVAEPEAEKAPEPKKLKDHPADSELDELEPEKDLIEIDPDTIPENQKAEFFKWLKTIEK